MPFLPGDPAGTFRGKAQDCVGGPAAGKNSISGGKFLIELFFRNIFGQLGKRFDFVDGINSETAQIITKMTPGIQVSVIAVINQPLGGDGTAEQLIIAPVVMANPELMAIKQGGHDHRKMISGYRPGGKVRNFDAFFHFTGIVAAAAQQAANTFFQRLQMAAGQAGLEIGKQGFHAEQGMKF